MGEAATKVVGVSPDVAGRVENGDESVEPIVEVACFVGIAAQILAQVLNQVCGVPVGVFEAGGGGAAGGWIDGDAVTVMGDGGVPLFRVHRPQGVSGEFSGAVEGVATLGGHVGVSEGHQGAGGGTGIVVEGGFLHEQASGVIANVSDDAFPVRGGGLGLPLAEEAVVDLDGADLFVGGAQGLGLYRRRRGLRHGVDVFAVGSSGGGAARQPGLGESAEQVVLRRGDLAVRVGRGDGKPTQVEGVGRRVSDGVSLRDCRHRAAGRWSVSRGGDVPERVGGSPDTAVRVVGAGLGGEPVGCRRRVRRQLVDAGLQTQARRGPQGG